MKPSLEVKDKIFLGLEEAYRKLVATFGHLQEWQSGGNRPA